MIDIDAETHSKILRANIDTHKIEAPLYDAIHFEIFNPCEQKRLTESFSAVAESLPLRDRRALDIGCGTGNVTEKLLQLGFTVDAVDLSPEMADVLRQKRAREIAGGQLKVQVGLLDELSFAPGYSMITSYSVIHHLPDYLATIRRCISLLSKGGVIYMDHEPISQTEQSPVLRAVTAFLNRVDFVLRIPYLIYRKILKMGFPKAYAKLLPNINYEVSDYWVHEDRCIDHHAIQSLAKEQGCTWQRDLYLVHGGRWMDTIIYFLFSKRYANTQLMTLRKP